jgi:uncharacterized protein YcfL
MINTYLSKFLSYGFLALLFLLGACSQKAKVGTVSKQDPQDQSSEPEIKKVEFGGGLDNKLEVVRITQGKVDGDLLHIQVELKNISNREVKCTHRLEWLNDEGFLVKDTSLVWKALMVRPGESKMIDSISTRAGFAAFRLKIQPAKNP